MGLSALGSPPAPSPWGTLFSHPGTQKLPTWPGLPLPDPVGRARWVGSLVRAHFVTPSGVFILLLGNSCRYKAGAAPSALSSLPASGIPQSLPHSCLSPPDLAWPGHGLDGVFPTRVLGSGGVRASEFGPPVSQRAPATPEHASVQPGVSRHRLEPDGGRHLCGDSTEGGSAGAFSQTARSGPSRDLPFCSLETVEHPVCGSPGLYSP